MRVERYDPGVPSWVDVGTSDLKADIAFYSELLGWTAQDMGEEAGHYNICTYGGSMVAGIGPLMSPGPSHWTTYVNVTSADETTAKVAGAGGQVLMGPMDVMTSGRMALFADPSGGVIGVWQPNQHPGAQLVNEPPAWTWSHLLSTDFDKAAAFYAEVFDWGVEADDQMQGTIFTVDGRPVCGGMPMPADVPAGTPSFWQVFFAVGDADATAARIGELGGQVIMGPQDTPVGRLYAAIDPTGAVFGTAQPTAS